MCGIAGIISTNNNIPKCIIERMTDSLIHRGPNEEGIFFSKNVHLGSRRLSIVDTSNGIQPVFNENNSIVAVFNGEIYNYKELVIDLINRGHLFKSKCDSEVIVHLYEEYGMKFLDLIDGQFAFGIYDKNNQKFYLARDRIGICPLYYTVKNETIYFASEMKAFAKIENFRFTPNTSGLYEQFVYWTTINTNTVFENINQIPPSSYLIIDKYRDIQCKKYHSFSRYNKNIKYKNIQELKHSIRETLIHSIKDRLMCDENVKFGLYLSGGLDSTILLKLLNEIGCDDITTLSLGFEDYKIDESAYQKLGIKGNKGEHIKVKITENDIVSGITKVIKHCETPLYKFGPIPMYMLSKAANQNGIKFVLSGEGADEIFYGYDIYKETLYRKYLSLNPNSELRANDIEKIIYSINSNNKYILQGYKEYYSRFLSGSSNILYSMQSRIRGSSSIIDYFNEDNKSCIKLKNIEAQMQEQFDSETKSLSLLKKCQAVQMHILLAGYLLSSQGDRVLMANSVEGRYPFLDRKLIELAYSIPDNFKLSQYNEKYILKETFKEIIPKQILKRKKYQYTTPNSKIILNNMEKFELYLSKNAFDKYGIFDFNKVQFLIKKLNDLSENDQNNISDDMIFIYIVTTHMLLDVADKGFL